MEEQEKKKLILKVQFHRLKPGEEIPKVAMYLLDATGRVQKKVASVVEGKLTLDPILTKDVQKILALGRDVEDLKQIRRDTLLQFGIWDQWPIWKKTKVIEIPRDWWSDWRMFKVCVSGRVRKCWPMIIYPLRLWHPGGTRQAILPPLFPRYSPICNGLVEVYERKCCWSQWIIPDIHPILEKLRDLIKVWPPKPWPPPPPPPYGIGPILGPDPVPIHKAELRSLKRAESFGMRPLMFEPPLHLSQYIKALETLPQAEAIKYVRETPLLWHLWGTCSDRKLGEAILGPDGHFTFCYTPLFGLFRRGMVCRISYFYKVKQWHENQWVPLYDGSTAHQYFTADQFADLRTWLGRACPGDDPDIPVDKSFVMLQDIGSTHSWRLVSHWLGKDATTGNDLTQNGENSVANPPANGGLVNPPSPGASPIPANPVITPTPGIRTTNPNPWLVNQPWGEVLSFRIFFHPDMKDLGAHYYRISIVQAGADGNPMPDATPIPLTNPLSWLRFEYVNRQVQVRAESLGPEIKTVEGNVETGLYRIPYREDALWLDGQYHQYWDTILNENGKYLVTLEVFDSTGRRLKPTGSIGTGREIDFDYLRWLEETGPDSVAKVPFAKLVHLFWIDNRECRADIIDLRKDHSPSYEECQFLTGKAKSQFSAGFRAFHKTQNSMTPPETFMWYYTIWHHRGLDGPDVAIETGGRNTPSTLDAGNPAESSQQTFEDMLGTKTIGAKCTFALNLRVYTKHTNGSRRLSEYDRFDQAAFALEIAPPGQAGA